MGAGKTVVGRRVAGRLGRPFVDADAAIEAHAGMPIPQIFAKRGELWFRRTEEDVVRELLRGEPGVLALGGGALENARTRGLVGRVADLVWLRADVEVAWARVEGSGRPLATDRARFARRAAAREENYRAAAHHVVDADGPPDAVADAVIAWALRAAEARA
jgi:shikimate kinase